jgi:hypothetical protein
MAGMIGLRTASGIKKCELIPICHRHFAIDDGFQRFVGDLRFQASVKFTRMTRASVERSVKGFGLERSNPSFWRNVRTRNRFPLSLELLGSRPCPASDGLNQLFVLLHRIGPFDGRVTANHRLVVMDDIDDALEQFRLEGRFVAGIVA